MAYPLPKRDARLAFRALRRRPGLVLTAVLSLGLGLGACTTMFSAFDALLLKPIPLPGSERLVALTDRIKGRPSGGNPTRLLDFARAPAFAAVAGLYGDSRVHVIPEAPYRVEILNGVGDLLGVIGVPLAQGRPFTQDEARGLGQPVAIASLTYWNSRLAASGCTLPCPLNLSGVDVTVIGVLPASFRYPAGIDLVMPAPRDVQAGNQRRARFLQMIGRLNPDQNPAQAQAQVNTLSSALARQFPDTDKDVATSVVPLAEAETGRNRDSGLASFGAVLFVLLIDCVNLSGLLLARAAERQRESAIRVSLGAGPAALLRLYLFESLWLALAGGGLGVALAAYAVPWLKSVIPAELPMASEIHFDIRAALFALGATLVSALLFGFAPAWRAARARHVALQSRSTGAASALHLRRFLVSAQVVLTVVLLTGAVLVSRSLFAMTRAPLGIEPQGLLTLSVNYPWDTSKSTLDRFEQDALSRLAALPGVSAASVIDRLPLEGGAQTRPVQIQARTLPPDLATRPVSIRTAHSAAFATLGAALPLGRVFREGSGGRELIVNDAFVRRYFGADNPIGRLVSYEGKGAPPVWREIVGVVSEIRESATQTEPVPQIFLPRASEYWPMMRFLLRTQVDPGTLAPAARAELVRIDAAVPLSTAQTMDQALGAEFKLPTTISALLAGFALAALALTLIGLYGILSSDVAQRTREIGVRLALGATPTEVVRELVRRGLWVTLLGLLPGLAFAAWVTRALASLLYGVRPLDPFSFAFPTILLLLCAALASFLPARRAATIDPSEALRHE